VRDGFLRHPLLEAGGVEHGFGLRGAAEPPGVRRPRQVHGAAVVSAEDCGSEPPEADAVLSLEPGVAVGVITADCVPILAASVGGGAVLAVHAGWRGLAQGVIETAIGALREAAGDRLVAAIGPHVGACCYEVDEPVLAALSRRYADALSAALRPSQPGRAWLDLGRLAQAALAAAGLASDAIGALPDTCTACDRERFHSYRRDGPRSGRLHHFVRAGPGRLDTPGGAA
jgi:YfiH family protein